MAYPALLPLMRTLRVPLVEWTDSPLPIYTNSSVSPKDEIWFLRVCHHISSAVYCTEVRPVPHWHTCQIINAVSWEKRDKKISLFQYYPKTTGFRGRHGIGELHAQWLIIFLTRCLKQNKTLGTAIAELFSTWKHFLTVDNPPNFTDRNTQIIIGIFFRGSSCVPPTRQAEVKRKLTTRM